MDRTPVVRKRLAQVRVHSAQMVFLLGFGDDKVNGFVQQILTVQPNLVTVTGSEIMWFKKILQIKYIEILGK